MPPAEELSKIALIPTDTHDPFSRSYARLASGYCEAPVVPTVLIGVGALGSQLASIAARGGYGQWWFIDDDFLLPHNLARHVLDPNCVGFSKADVMKFKTNNLLGQGSAEAIHANVLVGPENASVKAAFGKAERIIDASASVAVERWLACDAIRNARAASCFLTPSGNDAVLLTEGSGKSPRLDHLEMSYYRMLIEDDHLEGHLAAGEIALHIGGCRSPSVKIPQTKVSLFAGCLVNAICEESWPESGAIEIWRSRSGLKGVDYYSYPGEQYVTSKVGEWSICIRQSLIEEIRAARGKAGKSETGGILAGMWDRERNIVYVVRHFDPPPDSRHEPSGFVRGVVGVYQTITDVERKTANNLTYIGEWHTHPPGHDSHPSTDDEKLLWWIHEALEWSDAPAFILIAGEDGFRGVLKQNVGGYQHAIITTR